MVPLFLHLFLLASISEVVIPKVAFTDVYTISEATIHYIAVYIIDHLDK